MAKREHVPQRMCVACREKGDKGSFIRLGEGRGAYVHDSPDCITAAVKKRCFDRALRGKMNILNTLGLCIKAGKVITGFDAVVEDINKAAGILITADLSDKTKKEILFHSNKHNKKLVEINYTMEEVAGIVGKRTGVIAILDKGLFTAITK